MNNSLIYSLALLLLLINFSGCKEAARYKSSPSVKSKTSQKTLKIPDYIIYDVKHYHYNKGKLSVRIDFKRGIYYSDESLLRIENCSFVYYDENGTISSKGRADRAKLYMQKSFMEAWGNIEIDSVKNGTKLTTSYIEWDGDKDMFKTDKPVTITRKNGDTITGIGMEADIALNVVTIKKNVKGVIKAR